MSAFSRTVLLTGSSSGKPTRSQLLGIFGRQPFLHEVEHLFVLFLYLGHARHDDFSRSFVWHMINHPAHPKAR